MNLSTSDGLRPSGVCVPCPTAWDILKDNLTTTRFSVNYVGRLGLMRTDIPENARVNMQFHLDSVTAQDLAGQAVRLGLTYDELLRQICWALSESMSNANDLR